MSGGDTFIITGSRLIPPRSSTRELPRCTSHWILGPATTFETGSGATLTHYEMNPTPTFPLDLMTHTANKGTFYSSLSIKSKHYKAYLQHWGRGPKRPPILAAEASAGSIATPSHDSTPTLHHQRLNVVTQTVATPSLACQDFPR